MRAWWRDLHAEMEGYAQAIGSVDENAMAITQIDLQGLAGWDVIIDGAVAWNGVPASLKAACLDPLPEPPVGDPTVAPDGTPRNPCPPALALAQGEVRPRQRQGRERAAAGRDLQGGRRRSTARR